MRSRCKHCFTWQKLKNELVVACEYCDYVLRNHGEYQDYHKKFITESAENYRYIHNKYGCVSRHWNYDAMKQTAYRKLAKL